MVHEHLDLLYYFQFSSGIWGLYMVSAALVALVLHNASPVQ